MNFTLRAALGFRRRMGAKAGLVVLRPLVDQLTGSDRAEAILAALECARELSDEESYGTLVAQWVGADATHVFEALAKEVSATLAFSPRLARELAGAERVRSPADARAHYLLARATTDDERGASYAQALRLASRPPVRESYVAQIVASMLSEGLDPGRVHVASLAEEQVKMLSSRSQIAIARYRLANLRGYRRVAVLDALLERMSGGPEAALALEVVGEFADRQRPTPLEWDRLTAAAASAGDETKRRFEMWRALREGNEGGSALARAAAVATSNAAASIYAAPIDSGADDWAWTEAQRQAASDAYGAILKLRKGKDVDFAPFIANAAHAGAPALALCALALSKADNEAANLAEALAKHSPARRGWLQLSNASAARGPTPLTSELLERALERREPGAERALGYDLRRRAWASRDQEEALALMARARRLLGSS